MTTGIHLRDARGPDGIRIYSIGDIHGRLDLLTRLHEQIRSEIDADGCSDWRIIHLGDYVDRGPDSRGVIDFLIAATQRDPRHLCLAGNHDIGFLDFMADPNPSQDTLFMQFGGVETARSYGVQLAAERLRLFDIFRTDLVRAVPSEHVAFLRSCAFSLMFEDFFFCHAGIRAGVALDKQSRHDLIWIRQGFLDHSGLHPKVIVHGHTIVPEPEMLPNRIGIDTGAYRTGVLTALVIDGAEKRLIST